MTERDIPKDPIRESKETLAEHKIVKRLAQAGLRLYMASRGLSASRNSYITRGFIEGAVLGSPLSYPNLANGAISHQRAGGGSWVGYDFNRPREFPREAQQGKLQLLKEGKVVAFILDQIKDNEPDDLTPTGLFDVADLDHMLSMDTISLGGLVDLGMVKLTTHAQAYEQLGLLGRYGEDLTSRSVADDPAFQVTPKGNGLIMLTSDFGDREPRPERQTSPVFIPGLTPRF